VPARVRGPIGREEADPAAVCSANPIGGGFLRFMRKGASARGQSPNGGGERLSRWLLWTAAIGGGCMRAGGTYAEDKN